MSVVLRRGGPQMVDAMETRMRQRVIDGVAAIIGREAAEELGADVYRDPPAMQLAPDALSALAEAETRWRRKDRETER